RLGVEQLAIIPGNHDVDWKPGSLASRANNRQVSQAAYTRFLRLLGKKDSNDIDVVTVRSKSGRRSLTVIGFDSNAIEGPNAAGIGYVRTSGFDAAEKHIRSKPKLTEQSLLWLAVHHHVFAASSARIDDAEKKKVSVLGNSAALQSKAMKWSAELIMH